MSQILDILSKENDRSTEESRAVIYLYQEGSFYRAYEWSAWLCHRFIKQFKVTHRKMKNIEQSVCFVGFPVTSLSRHTPEGADITQAGEKEFIVVLPANIIPDDLTLDMMSVDFGRWKEACPLTETTPKKATVVSDSSEFIQTNSSPMNLTGIMQQILSFPLENRTPMQCMTFIAETKTKLAQLI